MRLWSQKTSNSATARQHHSCVCIRTFHIMCKQLGGLRAQSSEFQIMVMTNKCWRDLHVSRIQEHAKQGLTYLGTTVWPRALLCANVVRFIVTITFLFDNVLDIDQFRCSKIHPKTIDLNIRLWGINTDRVCGVYSPEPSAEVFHFRMDFDISKLGYCE